MTSLLTPEKREPIKRKLLTTSEVASRLVVSPDTVRAMIAQGRLPALDMNSGGGRPNYRVSESDLARFIESGRVAVVHAPARRRSRAIPNLIGL